MYRIGICDDGHNVCEYIDETIHAYAKKNDITIETSVWYSGESLCKYLRQGNGLDLLYLDIELFEMSGIDVGKFIRNQIGNRSMQIVYISCKQSYAQKLFKTQPMDFLVKPISVSEIEESLTLALELLKKKWKQFVFQYGKEYHFIPYEEILYFVSEGRKVRIVTMTGEKEFYGKLRDVIKELSDEFIVIHKSYVVNKSYIAKYKYELVELINGKTLMISKVNRKQVRQRILNGV